MKGITTCEDCVIELWKTDCGDCEAAKPIVAELEREGYDFEKYNIETPAGRELWEEYLSEIDKNSKNQGYDEGYIYTPTFINPKTRKILAFSNRAPTKDELIKLAQGGSV
ncbi:thioredoxin family protein [Candidatus Microgenomates bacterium]|nr:thioredoxin family protein [Candidatus Microgenomates bacterium]